MDDHNPITDVDDDGASRTQLSAALAPRNPPERRASGIAIRRLEKIGGRGSLAACFDVEILAFSLVLRDCMAGFKLGRHWVSLPSRPRVEQGQLVKIGNKQSYEPTVTFATLTMSLRFHDAVIALLLEIDPHLFDNVEAAVRGSR